MINLSTKKYYATEEYVADAIAGLGVGTGGGASSWNDLTDKPFYKEVAINEDSYWETTVETVGNGYDDSYSSASLTTFPSYFNTENGSEIYVEINDVVYTTCFRPGGYGNTIGSSTLSGYGSGGDEPFSLANGMGGKAFRTTLGIGTYNIKVYSLNIDIKTLDTEFFPKGYPTVSYTMEPVEFSVTIGSEMYAGLGRFSNQFKEGKTYHIIFNDVEYSCVAWADENGATYIGNGDVYGGQGKGEDVPFSCDSNNEGYVYLNVMEAGDYRISFLEYEEPKEHVTPMDDKFIPDTIARRTDATSWIALTDKPFNQEVNVVSAVWERTITTSGASRWTSDDISGFPFLSDYAEHTVEIDGEIYKTRYNKLDTGFVIGNANGISSSYADTGEPFVIYKGAGTNFQVFKTTLGAGTHHVKVYIVDEKVKPLDTVFLPDGFPKVVYSTAVLADNITVSNNSEFDFTPERDTQYTVILNNEVADYVSTYDPLGCYAIITGEGFTISGKSNTTGATIVFEDASIESATLTIKGPVPSYIPMAQKFLPDTVATKAWVEALIGGIVNGTY